MCVACVDTWVLYWVSAVRPFVANMANAVTNTFWSLTCGMRVYVLCVCLDLGLVVGLRVQGHWLDTTQVANTTTNALVVSGCAVCECTASVFECAYVEYAVGWHNLCVCGCGLVFGRSCIVGVKTFVRRGTAVTICVDILDDDVNVPGTCV